MVKVLHSNGTNQATTGTIILISDKMDFELKLIRGDKEGHFILNKRTINKKNISILDLRVPNSGCPIL